MPTFTGTLEWAYRTSEGAIVRHENPALDGLINHEDLLDEPFCLTVRASHVISLDSGLHGLKKQVVAEESHFAREDVLSGE